MKKIIILICLMLTGCDDNLPPCAPVKNDDYKTGLFSRSLGSVNINGETCEIFEQYNRTQCRLIDNYQPRRTKCSGNVVECYDEIITRVTKCPSGFVTNTITYSQDKFHVEHIQ